MTAGIFALVAAAVFGWGVFSRRLERADLTSPIVFVAVGLVIANVASLNPHVETETVKLVTEVTLAWVLFSDAARVGVRELRHEANVYIRLLAIALPMTVALGWLLAWGLFGEFNVWLALLVGAALAPTDAALGAAVINNPAVPGRVRGILNVESGLNDGIVTPIVLVALAGAASAEGHGGGGAVHAIAQLAIGTAIGIGTGYAGGWILRFARHRQWVEEEFLGPAVLALALLAYAASVAADGNGFVAAFAGGIAFGHVAGPAAPKQVFYVEQTADLAALLVWLTFGVVAVPLIVDGSWLAVLYAVISLTVVRMLPVAAVLYGTSLGGRTAIFIGWFGPRGLASVVFALLAVEELGQRADSAVAVIATTVLFSVLAHGFSARPLASRYGPSLDPTSPASVGPPARGPIG